MKRILIPFVAVVLAVPGYAAAPPKIDAASVREAGMDPQLVARIPARMREFVEQGTAAGFVTLVARRGHVVSLEATGLQNIESKTPITTDSIFQIASMTKPITAVGVMILVEEGRIALVDPVEKHLPEFHNMWMVDRDAKAPEGGRVLKRPSRPITIRDLLTHTSGLPGGFPDALKNIFERRNRTLAEAVAIYSQQPLEFEPGTEWRYSNMGIATLGRIIEVVSGMPYEQFIARRILEPLGMKDSFYFPPAEKYGRIAQIYDLVDGKLQTTGRDLYRKGAKYPAPEGGLYSTAADLDRFYQMMLNGGTLDGTRILSRSTVELMTRNQTGDLKAGFAPGMGYGLAFGVVRNVDGMFRGNSIGTFGHGGAYRTYVFADPRKELIGVILYQRVSGGGDVADEINAFIEMANAAVVE